MSYETALNDIKAKNPLSAIDNLGLCINILSESPGNPENHRLLIDAAIKRSELIFIRSDFHLDAPDFLEKAKKAAVNIGDQRHAALINLYLWMVLPGPQQT